MNEQVHVWRKEPPPEDERKYDPADSRWLYIESDGTPDLKMLDRVTRSIVDQIDPLRIILFGSAARGEMHAHSDLDFLVIKERLGPRRGETSGRIRGRLPAERRAVDILLISPEEVEQNRDEVYQAVGQALAHGRTIYERQ
jgi:predicted nucleotidyltransferase